VRIVTCLHRPTATTRRQDPTCERKREACVREGAGGVVVEGGRTGEREEKEGGREGGRDVRDCPLTDSIPSHGHGHAYDHDHGHDHGHDDVHRHGHSHGHGHDESQSRSWSRS
jgi:hypothetical protein